MFLIAQVNKVTGRQRLIMQKIDPISGKIFLKNSIDCIHTAVGDIPVGEFKDTVEDPEFEEKVLYIRSSEKLKEINLSPDEKFKAFRRFNELVLIRPSFPYTEILAERAELVTVWFQVGIRGPQGRFRDGLWRCFIATPLGHLSRSQHLSPALRAEQKYLKRIRR